MADPTVDAVREDIHTYFSLSYANYLVLPRTLLQSMPADWQHEFVQLLRQADAAFEHVPQAEAYDVTAGTESEVWSLTDAEMKRVGITADWYRGETPPEGWSGEDLAEWRNDHEDPDGPTYSRDGAEVHGSDTVLLPAVDPVPHYNRGRTRVEPDLDAMRAALEG